MSAPIYKHYGKVVKKEMHFYHPEILQNIINSLEGKEFELILKEKHKKVTHDTHSYYRGGIVKEALQYECFGGYTEDDFHELMASMFLTVHSTKLIHGDTEEPLQIPCSRTRSTSELTQKEMGEFIEKVIRFLAQQGIVIKTPEQYYLEKL